MTLDAATSTSARGRRSGWNKTQDTMNAKQTIVKRFKCRRWRRRTVTNSSALDNFSKTSSQTRSGNQRVVLQSKAGRYLDNRRMSGDLLRRSAIFGDVENIKSLLEQGSNPCSMDEFGLTALHYAAWNGHIRCVEVLCVNDIGRDDKGRQRSCIDLQSCRGYTALHLAASDGVDGVEVINTLLNSGADRTVRDLDGRTAVEAASEAGRTECVRALNLEIGHAKDLRGYRQKMEAKLRVQRAQLISSEPGKKKERRAPKPKDLIMQEDEIVPFSETHFSGKHEKATIQNLIIAKEQASISERRRKVLAESQETTARKALESKFL